MSGPFALRAILACGLLAGTFATTPAAEDKPGTAAAKCEKVAGALLQRAGADGAWRPVLAGDPVAAEVLLVALPDSQILSAGRTVQLNQLADISQRGPYPVLESAVRLHQTPGFDLDFTLERGIATITNRKEKGAARVRFRFLKHTWDLTLLDPGTRVGMEIYGRHPPGRPHLIQKDSEKDEPVVNVKLLVHQGQVQLAGHGVELHLKVPPGTALLSWDNIAGKLEPEHLDKLPPTILPTTSAEISRHKDACWVLDRLNDRPIDKALKQMVESDKKLEERCGVILLGALDQLPQLIDALCRSPIAEVRDGSIVVLRGWIGRGPGQLEKFYDALKKHKGVTAVQASGVVHLLLGFTEEEQQEPVTYELLIESLKSSKLPIRELARWHLVRLVPDGKKIGYDAGAPEAERNRAFEQWRALVPAGKLPPRPKAPSPAK